MSPSGTRKCDILNGICLHGCKVGWALPSCKECDNNHYGSKCDHKCSANCQMQTSGNRTCSITDGRCINGCTRGWMTNSCETCDNKHFGVTCGHECSANCQIQTSGNRTCSITEGRCLNGCTLGWTMDSCDICDNNHYGSKCNYECSANCQMQTSGNRNCSITDGRCITGCTPGWQSSTCNSECDERKFGLECSSTCHCLNTTESCNKITGICVTGCAASFMGQDCQKRCNDTHYGIGCVKMCSEFCKQPLSGNRTCTITDGICRNDCKPGFASSTCTEVCANGTYGDDCSRNCSVGCNDYECNAIHGGCECMPGWERKRCDQACGPGFYGRSCNKTCNENCNGMCNITTGHCFECKTGWTGQQCGKVILQSQDMTTLKVVTFAIPPVVGFSVLAIIVAVIIRRRKQLPAKSTAKKIGHSRAQSFDGVKIMESSVDELSNMSNGDTRLQEDDHNAVYYNIAETCASTTVVKLEEFPAYVEKHRSDKTHLYAEFLKLPTDLVNDHSVAKSTFNVKKNRYLNICAYNHSRVVLYSDLQNDNVGDYINACYIDAPTKHQSFIAAQGPTQFIINDFIRMIWEKDIQRVVMLTNVIEEGTQKCVQYWPDAVNGSKTFGKISICLDGFDEHASFTIRRFSLTKVGQSTRLVTQYHFTTWPDKGVPKSAWSLLDFREKVMASQQSNESPILVHCSAGVGRTGTFIALQCLKEEADKNESQDVFTCVWNLRHQRVNMVQTKEQYVFLHEAALASLITTRSIWPVDEFWQEHQYILEQNDKIETEFKIVQAYPIEPDNEDYALNTENKDKNRHMTILAGDSVRPALIVNSSIPEMTSTYINAVFLPSYDKPRRFIQTQTPLPNTVLDLWRLVWDHSVEAIVMLDNYTKSQGNIAVYWPSIDSTLEAGPFTVEHISHSDQGDITVNQLLIKQGSTSRKVCHYTGKFSPQSDDLPSISSMLQLINMANTTRRSSSIIVQCRSGTTESGLFCAVLAILDRILKDKTVCVASTVGSIKTGRKQNISSLDQYKYCYKAIVEYLSLEQVYMNSELNKDVIATNSSDVKDQYDSQDNLYYNL